MFKIHQLSVFIVAAIFFSACFSEDKQVKTNNISDLPQKKQVYKNIVASNNIDTIKSKIQNLKYAKFAFIKKSMPDPNQYDGTFPAHKDDSLFLSLLVEGQQAMPLLIDKMDDTTSTTVKFEGVNVKFKLGQLCLMAFEFLIIDHRHTAYPTPFMILHEDEYPTYMPHYAEKALLWSYYTLFGNNGNPASARRMAKIKKIYQFWYEYMEFELIEVQLPISPDVKYPLPQVVDNHKIIWLEPKFVYSKIIGTKKEEKKYQDINKKILKLWQE